MSRHQIAARRIQALHNNRSRARGFPNLNRQSVGNELRRRTSSRWGPDLIAQRAASLCGPAAFIRDIARRYPDVYAKYVIDLYETGEGSIRDLDVEPGDDCRNYRIPPDRNGAYPIAHADWIALASLRDSENTFFDYDSVDDQVAGITMPGEIVSWARRARLRSSDGVDFSGRGLDALFWLDRAWSRGRSAHILLNAGIINGRDKSSSTFPNHWVSIAGHVRIGGRDMSYHVSSGAEARRTRSLLSQSIHIPIFTWGSTTSYAITNCTVDEFLGNYFGQVYVH